jgi:hypothetical protein
MGCLRDYVGIMTGVPEQQICHYEVRLMAIALS